MRPWLPAPSAKALQLGQRQQRAVHALWQRLSTLQQRHSWFEERSSAIARAAGRAEGRGSACWISCVAGEGNRTL